MSSRPWMPLYVADFQLDTLDLSADQVGVYMIMLMLAWRRHDGALPNDMEWLRCSLKRRIANFHGHQFNRIVPGLLQRYFTLRNGKWQNKRLTKERQISRKLSANNKQKARKRWARDKEINKLSNAVALPLQSQSQPQPQEDISSLRSENARVRASPSDFRQQFEQFWQRYPHKIGKQAAYKAFSVVMRKGKISFGRLMVALEAYIAKTDDRPWCNPATWLNQGRWDDEPSQVNGHGKPGHGKSSGSLLDAIDKLQFGGESGADQASSADAVQRLPAR